MKKFENDKLDQTEGVEIQSKKIGRPKKQTNNSTKQNKCVQNKAESPATRSKTKRKLV